MAKLVLSFNGDVVNEYTLDQETTTIGRKPGNDIQIDNLAVSGTHAKILTILNDSFIEDLGSTNGTFIGGEKITKHALKDGDVIQIGKHELKYVNEASAEEGEFEKTMIIRPDAAGMQEEATEDKKLEKEVGKIASDLAKAGAAGAAGPGPAHLKLMSGTNSGKELKLTKILTTLGKPGVQVAAITRRPTGYFLIVVDAGSSDRNPTVNETEVGKQAHPLNSGDVIAVAGVEMSFHLD